ncbi:MAG: Hsp20/alpha crystallin family protein [Betaproteobacteria bacterium]
MFFATSPSPLAAGFGTAFDHPLRRRVYAQAGHSASQFLEKSLAATRNASAQDAEIDQDEKQFTLTLDVPGITKEQLAIRIEGAIVRIESKDDAPRRYRAAYEFGQEIDTAASNAKLENGVLSLTLAKLVPVSKATELAIG